MFTVDAQDSTFFFLCVCVCVASSVCIERLSLFPHLTKQPRQDTEQVFEKVSLSLEDHCSHLQNNHQLASIDVNNEAIHCICVCVCSCVFDTHDWSIYRQKSENLSQSYLILVFYMYQAAVVKVLK